MIGTGKLEWESGYPKLDNVTRNCIAWKALKIMNTKCDASEDHYTPSAGDMKPYYDKSNKDQPFDNTLLQRGYLCETRAIHTIAAYGHQVFNRHIPLIELKANIISINMFISIP